MVEGVVDHERPNAQGRRHVGGADQWTERVDDPEVVGSLQRGVAERLRLAGDVLPLHT